MLSNDVYGKFINPGASEHKKVMVGKIGGIIAVFGLLWIAWNPPGTLYDIFVLKFELLVQVFPAFVLGLYWKRLSGKAVFWGMLAGAVLAGFLTLTGHKTVFGIHGGVLGLGLNFFVCLVGSLIIPATAKSSLKDEELAVLEMRA